MSSQKRHYFLLHASIRNPNDPQGIEQQYNSTINIETKQITSTLLEKIRLDVVSQIKVNWPEVVVEECRLNSLSYLGEMTPEEFNA